MRARRALSGSLAAIAPKPPVTHELQTRARALIGKTDVIAACHRRAAGREFALINDTRRILAGTARGRHVRCIRGAGHTRLWRPHRRRPWRRWPGVA